MALQTIQTTVMVALPETRTRLQFQFVAMALLVQTKVALLRQILHLQTQARQARWVLAHHPHHQVLVAATAQLVVAVVVTTEVALACSVAQVVHLGMTQPKFHRRVT